MSYFASLSPTVKALSVVVMVGFVLLIILMGSISMRKVEGTWEFVDGPDKGVQLKFEKLESDVFKVTKLTADGVEMTTYPAETVYFYRWKNGKFGLDKPADVDKETEYLYKFNSVAFSTKLYRKSKTGKGTYLKKIK